MNFSDLGHYFYLAIINNHLAVVSFMCSEEFVRRYPSFNPAEGANAPIRHAAEQGFTDILKFHP